MADLSAAVKTTGFYTGHFKVKVDGIDIGHFLEVSGLHVQIEVDEIAAGGQNHYVHKFPGRMTWPNIRLKRGVTDNDNLFEWMHKSSGYGYAADRSLKRATMAIELIDQDRSTLRSWEFVDAFPVEWTGPSFVAGDQGIATEELEIAHHGFAPRG